MIMTTKTAPYTLSLAGRDWAFTPEAVEALALAGWLPHLLAAALEVAKIEAGLAEVNVKGAGVFAVTRHGRRVRVEVADPDHPSWPAGPRSTQTAPRKPRKAPRKASDATMVAGSATDAPEAPGAAPEGPGPAILKRRNKREIRGRG